MGIRFGFGLRVRECVLRLRCVVRVLVFFGGGGVACVLLLGVCHCALFLRLPLRGRLFLEQGRPFVCVCLFVPSLVLRVRCCGPLFLLLLLVAGVRVLSLP